MAYVLAVMNDSTAQASSAPPYGAGMYLTNDRRAQMSCGMGCGSVIAFTQSLRQDTCVQNPPGGL
jgi:hypothetical protein